MASGMLGKGYKMEADGDYRSFSESKQMPVTVLASGEEVGLDYALALGLRNFKVVTTIEQTQGMRTRALVISPGYHQWLERKRWELQGVLDAAIQNLYTTPNHKVG